MTRPNLLLYLVLSLASLAAADDRRALGGFGADASGSDPLYARRAAACASDGIRVSTHLAFFDSPRFRLAVIDLGEAADGPSRSLAEVFRQAGCAAGVNGGFFHPDRRPAGLMIAEGQRVNRFETAKLLSGVIYSDERGIHLVRRARFSDRPGIHALLQTGPYLVEHGRPVLGLSRSKDRQRTFIATDWRGHWVIGATTSRVNLADLAECLATPGALMPWAVDRAINLDGGSSTGFFFDTGTDAVLMQPRKPVRNLLGILPRRGGRQPAD